MNQWLSFSSRPAVAVGVIVLGVLLVVGLFVVPDAKRVSLKRRRPYGSGPSSFNRASALAAQRVEQILSTRARPLAEKLELAGLKTTPTEYAIFIIAGTLVGIALGFLAGSLLLGIVLMIAPAIVGLVTVNILISRRRAAFANQLDETAQMMAGSLRSGYSFNQAMTAVAKEADQPTAEEFARVVNELRLGRPFEEAMAVAASRMKNEDFVWILQAVSINREVGGNLADVLEEVSRTIRERSDLRRQVATLSAEGRLSAIVLMALPFVVGGFVAWSNPVYLNPLFTTPLGLAMVVVGIVLLIVGALWLRATVRIKY
ncbi:MAG: type II secretion system F family protein [Propionibacteriaceae bacterium]|nr:type II secretion system F family protein [Propionibacteriaceae bacterium]